MADGYYSQPRKEVVSLIDSIEGRRFLDIGCGMGGLGRELREKGCSTLCGVEISVAAAKEAHDIYDVVVTGDIATVDIPYPEGYFDGIICADVLEHLENPWLVLKKLRGLLSPVGILVASIPNIRNADSILNLLKGHFDYEDWGVMDRSHLRFFTLSSILDLFSFCGFSVETVTANMPQKAEEIVRVWQREGLADKIDDLIKTLKGVSHRTEHRDLMELLVIQYIVRARRADPAHGALNGRGTVSP